MKLRIRDFALVTIGAFIASVGYNTMLVENRIASGGVSGLAVSLRELFGWNPGNFVLILTVPLLTLCWFFLGREVFVKTFYGSLIFPTFIRLTESLPTITRQPLLAAIFGGAVLGFGLGLVFYGNSSTGGTGIITQIIHKYTPLPLGTVLLITDGTIVGISAIAFDLDTVMYSIISLIIVSYTVDTMMTGLNSSRNLLILSKQEATIKQIILEKGDRGVTKIPVTGGYTNQKQTMLMTTLSTHELPKIQKEILDIDPTAFMVVMPATKVMGRGFSLQKDYRDSDDDFLVPM